MSLDALKAKIGDFAKDIRLNISTVLTPEGAPDLTQAQIYTIALACAYATKNASLVADLKAMIGEELPPEAYEAAKAAAAIMAMNNIYYRFLHMVEDKEYSKMPARLRMNVIASSGIAKVDFELASLGVSAINGCGMCMEAHVHEVLKAGVSKTAVQSAIRIAAVVNAVAQALMIDV